MVLPSDEMIIYVENTKNFTKKCCKNKELSLASPQDIISIYKSQLHLYILTTDT